jgi:hypothetical protein
MKKSTTIRFTMNIAATIAILLTFASLTSYLTSMAYAQTNQTNKTTTGGATGTTTLNQTGAQITAQPTTTMVNQDNYTGTTDKRHSQPDY